MKILVFILWLVAGLCVLFGGEVSKLAYGLCWVNLMLELVYNLLDDRR